MEQQEEPEKEEEVALYAGGVLSCDRVWLDIGLCSCFRVWLVDRSVSHCVEAARRDERADSAEQLRWVKREDELSSAAVQACCVIVSGDKEVRVDSYERSTERLSLQSDHSQPCGQ